MGHKLDCESTGQLRSQSDLDANSYSFTFQILDVSENYLTSLGGLECLLQLRQLYANWNRLHVLADLASLPNLEILSVSGNAISSFDGMAQQVPGITNKRSRLARPPHHITLR